ncbi:MAG: hypothetical protein ACRDPH_03110 [Marmoricola sp.]
MKPEQADGNPTVVLCGPAAQVSPQSAIRCDPTGDAVNDLSVGEPGPVCDVSSGFQVDDLGVGVLTAPVLDASLLGRDMLLPQGDQAVDSGGVGRGYGVADRRA